MKRLKKRSTKMMVLMHRTTRVTAIVLGFFLLTLLLSPEITFASPSAEECIKDPELEGCEPVDSTGETDEVPVEGLENSESSPSLVWTILRLILVLLFILALIYGLLKFFNKKNKLFNRNRTMENLGGMTLAPNRSVQAVRIGEKVYILGVGESVQMITEIEDESTKKALLEQNDHSNIQSPFGLDQLVGNRARKGGRRQKKKTQQDISNSTPSSVQFQQLFENQLNDMKEKRKNLNQKGREDRYDE
ncbi:flagellar biosynthetic protein FliO [Halobacillus yeomjeoni]|uniref:Flagellar biosynthetic protein FliO n=1 Tax=Halobacillus yeomjeoni TaxID=311194 RepID=A0A931HTJ2_9BACI|nr:flagellar biosynthetic protein FliO [Halobacillus yeomjeoni]MBH0229284.1 flagellar biosynthetic protein FliO [Halobacillus yeomjeoni]